jgi:hypothetical protein
VLADTEKPIPEGMRILTNDDLEKVDAIETFEELKDREQHFKLYYSKDIETMQEWNRKKKQANICFFLSSSISFFEAFFFVNSLV